MNFKNNLVVPFPITPSLSDDVVKPWQNSKSPEAQHPQFLGHLMGQNVQPPTSTANPFNPLNILQEDGGQLIPFKMDHPPSKVQGQGSKRFAPEDYQG